MSAVLCSEYVCFCTVLCVQMCWVCRAITLMLCVILIHFFLSGLSLWPISICVYIYDGKCRFSKKSLMDCNMNQCNTAKHVH